MAGIELEKVSKSFGEVSVIPDLSLEIKDGEFVVFVGPSGCGKSTLLRLIAGLERVSGGHIRLAGETVEHLPPAKRGIAMVFQSYALYPHMSVRENIAFGLKIARLPAAEIEARVQRACNILNITEYLDRKPAQLSGGQRQRVAIGRAIVREPQAFLFDEPLSNLDAALRGQMRVELMSLHRRLKSTMIYVTHDQVEAMTMADRIVVLDRGHIIQTGTPSQVYNRPANEFVAGFIGSPRINLLPAEALSAAEGSRIGVRPEHLDLSTSEGLWRGEVVLSENLGSDTLIHVRLDHGAVTVRVQGEHVFEPETTVFVSPRPSSIHQFAKDGTHLRTGIQGR